MVSYWPHPIEHTRLTVLSVLAVVIFLYLLACSWHLGHTHPQRSLGGNDDGRSTSRCHTGETVQDRSLVVSNPRTNVFMWTNEESKVSDGKPNDTSRALAAGAAAAHGSVPCETRVVAKQPPLRVYVYELPPEIQLPLELEIYNDSRNNRLFMHACEFWMLMQLESLRRVEQPEFPVKQVDSPREADMFLVPFLGSQSRELCCPLHFRDNIEACNYMPDAERQFRLRSWLVRQKPWMRSDGHDHIFITSHPLALVEVRQHLRNSIFLAVDFGFYCANEVSLSKDVIIPYQQVVPGIPIHEFDAALRNGDKRKALLYFRGAQVREFGGIVRQQLWNVLKDEEGLNWVATNHSAAAVPEHSLREAGEGMSDSHFCLHPAGDTPSSARLWDALGSLCIPVIVSDYIELPFESWLDWSEFCLFVDTESATKPGFLMNLLREVPTAKRREMRKRITEVLPYFDYRPRSKGDPSPGALSLIWQEIAWKLPSVRIAVRRFKRRANRIVFTKDFNQGTRDSPCRKKPAGKVNQRRGARQQHT